MRNRIGLLIVTERKKVQSAFAKNTVVLTYALFFKHSLLKKKDKKASSFSRFQINNFFSF